MSSPLVSIIIPSYNCLSFLEDCFKPLEEFKPELIETIIVNDGSTDETEKYLETVAEKFPHFKIINQKNGGLSNARNSGIAVATGEYIYFCDADDAILAEPFLQMTEVLSRREYEVIVCNFLNQNPDLKSNKTYYPRSLLGEMTGADFMIHSLNKREYGSESFQFFFKRFLFDDAKFLDRIIHEDDHLYPSIFYRVNKLLVTDKVIYFRRYRTNSITRGKDSGVRRSTKDILKIINNYKSNLENYDEKKARVVFKTFQIRSWLSLLDYVKRRPEENNPEISGQKPNPWKTLIDPDILWRYRTKYFRRCLRM